MASSSRKGKEKMVVEEEEEEPTYGFHANNNNNNNNGGSTVRSFPPGYRFDPCDVELVLYYLKPKVNNERLPPNIMHEIDLYDPLRHEECNPEQLSARYAPQGDGEWYFFTPRDRKYPRGKRPNRAAGSGYWKASGKDAPIEFNGTIVGYKKALVFYEGRAPNGVKTNWIMHEYRLDYDMTNTPQLDKAQPSDRMKLDNWVLFRIHYNTKGENKKRDESSSPKKERKKPAKHAKPKPSSAESSPETVNIFTSHNTVMNTAMNTTTTTIKPSQFEFGAGSDVYLDTTDTPPTFGGVSAYGDNQSFIPYMCGSPTSYPVGWRQTLPFGCDSSNFEVGSCSLSTVGNALGCNDAINFEVGSYSLSTLENATGDENLYVMDSCMEGDFDIPDDDQLLVDMPDDFEYDDPN